MRDVFESEEFHTGGFWTIIGAAIAADILYVIQVFVSLSKYPKANREESGGLWNYMKIYTQDQLLNKIAWGIFIFAIVLLILYYILINVEGFRYAMIACAGVTILLAVAMWWTAEKTGGFSDMWFYFLMLPPFVAVILGIIDDDCRIPVFVLAGSFVWLKWGLYLLVFALVAGIIILVIWFSNSDYSSSGSKVMYIKDEYGNVEKWEKRE